MAIRIEIDLEEIKRKRSEGVKLAIRNHTMRVKGLKGSHVGCEHLSGCGTVCNLQPLKLLSEVKCPKG